MAADVDTIGLGVDSRQVVAATKNLDSLSRSADNASRKSDNFGSSTNSVTKKIGGLNEALSVTGKAATSTKDFFVGIISGALGAAAAYASVTASINLLQKSFNYADKINDVAKANEIAISSVLNLSNALMLNGGEAESTGKIFATFTEKIDDAATGGEATQKRFAQLGIGLKELATLDEEGLFDKTLQGLLAIEDPIRRNAIKMELLGKASKSVDIAGLAKDYEANKNNYDNAEKSFRSIGEAFDKIDKFSTNAQKSVAEKFGPALLDAVNYMEKNGPRIAKFLASINLPIKIFSGLYESDENAGKQSAEGKIKKISEQKAIREVIDPIAVAESKRANNSREQAKMQYESLIKSIKDKISAEKQEIALIAQGVPIEDAATIAKYKALGVSDKLIVSLLNINSAHNQALEAAKEEEKFYADYESSILKQAEAIDAQTESIISQSSALEFQNETFGKLPSAITDVTIARLNDKKTILESLGLAIDDIEAQIKAYEKLRAAQNGGEFLEAEKKRADEAASVFKKAEEDKIREFEKTTDSINNIFREGFSNLINGGKGTWKSFTQSLATTFKTTVADYIYKLFAQPFIVKIVASLLGMGATGAVGAAQGVLNGTGQNSIFGQLSSIKDIFSNGNNFITDSIGRIGQLLSNFGNSGTGFIKDIASSIGSLTQLNAGFISRALPYAGAVLQLAQGNLAGAALTAVGTFFGGPIGGAIGGALGSLFGKKKKIPRFSSQTLGEYENGQFASKNGAQLYKQLGANSQLGTLSEQFSKTFGALLKGFGLSDKISTKADLLKKRKASYGMFEASFDGGSINVGTSGKAKNVQQTFEQLIEKVLGTGIADAVAQSNLTAGVKKFFTSLTKKEDVADAISTLVNLNQALGDLPKVFNAIRNAIDTTAYNTSIADLKTRFAAIGTYTNLFYTEQEQFDTFTKQLLTQFSLINTELPATRQGFRALVDGIKVVNKATSEQFNGLVALAPAADQYYKSLEAQANAALGASDAIDGLSDRFRTMADLQRYQGLSRNYGVAFAESRIPSYDVGTNYVPNDGLAMLHKGEAVVPAKYNNTNGGGDMSALKSEIRGLKAVMVQMATSARRTAEILQNITPNGNALATEAA